MAKLHSSAILPGLPCLLASGISIIMAASPSFAAVDNFAALPLVTDLTVPNTVNDPNLKNAWGISYAPKGPFWISANATGVSTVYSVNPATHATSIVPLVVNIPGDGSVTGQVFNPSTSYRSDPFIFVSEDGTISGWKGSLGTHAETLIAGSTNNVYKGVALAQNGSDTFLYAANFRTGSIDWFKNDTLSGVQSGGFNDPGIPSGFAPFNVQALGSHLFVTYAMQDPLKHDDVTGLGNGYVDEFDLKGNLLARIGTEGTLNSPWGLAIAPSSLGKFSGDLLVGNFGDGHINAYKLSNSSFDGQLIGTNGKPLTIDGLWGLSVGNDGSAGSSTELYYTAGPNGEQNGEFGVIQAVPLPPTLPLFLSALGGISLVKRKSLMMLRL